MFDKLIESDTAAVVKPRRGYFLVSSVVVGILFVTALVVSLYAADIDLGVNEFDTATLLAPVAAEAPEPPPPAAEQPRTAAAATELPHRQSNILRIDEPPTEIPPISDSPNTQLARPEGRFLVTPGPETRGIGQQGADIGSRVGSGSGTSSAEFSQPVAEKEDKTEPPPPVKKEAKPPLVKSEGVINGKATFLPKPLYPATAKAVGAEGTVDVQVTIDEQGNVISSRAVNGNALLRPAAERAAWNAKFTTTYLSKLPVKVTGVIVYRFSRN
jgi:periplasmic protein TonB